MAAIDRSAVGALVATRAQAVHAYALAAGVPETERAQFIVAVLSAARGIGDVDEQLLAAAREACGSGWAARRRHRRGARRFRRGARTALPLEVATAALRALDPPAADVEAAEPEPPAAIPAPQQMRGWLPVAIDGVAAVVDPPRRPTSPGDWLPPAIRGVNGHVPYS